MSFKQLLSLDRSNYNLTELEMDDIAVFHLLWLDVSIHFNMYSLS